MKKVILFILFASLIMLFSVFFIFTTEKSDLLDVENTEINATITTDDEGHVTISWEPLPYTYLYKVEVYEPTTRIIDAEPEERLLYSSTTLGTSLELKKTAVPEYYKITAYGLFGKVTHEPKIVYDSNFPTPPHPVAIYKYPEEKKASLMPFLVWHKVPGAVCYELEILSAPPTDEGGTAFSPQNHLFDTRQIFTNGYQVDLRPFANLPVVYWRARALGLHLEPIGEFSPAEPIYLDASLPLPDKPIINIFDQEDDFTMPIYPAFEWIPLHDGKRYEVELMVEPPAEENNTEPSPNRVWSMITSDLTSTYDEYARRYAGEYYWRVRAIDDKGNTIGRYSDTEEFVVKEQKSRPKVIAFGDSITHGGGEVSYSPRSLEYSYTSYLDFPALNLGHSGDTTRTTLERFNEDVLPFNPENLLIMTGSNSLRSSMISANDMISDLAEIGRLCEEHDIRPIFLTLMPINPDNIMFAFQTPTDINWHAKMSAVNDFIRTQPYFIDLEPYFYDAEHKVLDTTLSADGLHPGIRGKKLMAEIINLHKDLLK